jgi:formylglycine-generating enzyme required for sulfatase activity/dipeptidyl aminopeptidase/acylaminoacyl peptidase
MPEPRATHPSPQQLADFALGKLPAAPAAAVREHLAACAGCRQQVEALPAWVATDADTLLPPHPQAGPGPACEVPPELARAKKFEIQAKLGEGGMGTVYKARHTFLGQLVAIKVLHAGKVGSPDARARFLREMQAVGQLSHPNIVRALDAEEIGDLLVLVMEYVPGITLGRLVAQRGPLPVDLACHCIVGAALGLQHAHERGLVHRDIKPANLIVTGREREVKVLDFGLARGSLGQMGPTNQTQMNTVLGTPAYMAPEQAVNARGADIRCDVYSLGCSLYFLLAGRPPFQKGTLMDFLLAHAQEAAVPLTDLRADVPAGLWAVIARMLAKKPEERFQTPAEVVQALQPFASPGGQVTASLPPLPALAAPATPLSSRALPVAGPAGRPEEGSLIASPGAERTLSAQRARRKGRGKRRRPAWALCGSGAALAVVLLGAGLLVLRPPGRKVAVDADQSGAPAPIIPAGEQGPGEIEMDETLRGLAGGDRRGKDIAVVTPKPADPATVPPVKKEVAVAPPKPPEAAPAPAPPVLPGEPLPPGALARLGGTWLRGRRSIFLPGGRLVRETGDGNLQISEVPSGKPLVTLRAADVPQRTRIGGSTIGVSRDGKLLAAVCWQGRTGIWETATGRLVRWLESGGFYSVVRCDFSPDGTLVAVGNAPAASAGGGDEIKVGVHEVSSGRRLVEAPGTNSVFAPDGRSLFVWQGYELDQPILRVGVPDGGQLAVLPSSGFLPGYAPPTDGTWLFEALASSTVQVREAATGKVKHSLAGPPGGPKRPVGFLHAPGGKELVAIGGQPLGVWCWDLETGKQLWQVPLTSIGSRWLTRLSPDGTTWVTSEGTGLVRVWDVRTGKQRSSFRADAIGHDRPAGVSADGKVVATTSPGAVSSTTLALWDAGTGKLLSDVHGHLAAITAAAFSADGAHVRTLSGDRTLRTWETAGGKQLTRTSVGPAAHLAVAADGKTLFVGRESGVIDVLDAPGEKVSRSIRAFTKGLVGLALSAGGKRLVSAGWDDDSRVLIQDAATGAKLHDFVAAGGALEQLAVRPDGEAIATTHADQRVRLWDGQGKKLLELAGRSQRITTAAREKAPYRVGSVALSADGHWLAFSDHEQGIALVDLRSGKEVGRAKPDVTFQALTPREELRDVLAFSPDGKTLAWSGVESSAEVFLFDVPACRVVRKLAGESKPVTALAFSPDGSKLLSGGADGSALIWKMFDPPAVKIEAPARPRELPAMTEKEVTNSIGMKLVRIPAGKFLMGSPSLEYGRNKDEAQHEVTLTKAFHMGVYPVTQAEYRTVMGANPSHFSADGWGKGVVEGMRTDRFPVEGVSWESAFVFCAKLSALEKEKEAGRKYRLPTEAEWEYACRAGTKTLYHSGSHEDDLQEVAWYHANSNSRPHNVGKKKANAWGLHDMHGNVYQWCSDWYGADYYQESDKEDPQGPKEGAARVLRGGCWLNFPYRCRAAARSSHVPVVASRYSIHYPRNMGFRVVCVRAGAR